MKNIRALRRLLKKGEKLYWSRRTSWGQSYGFQIFGVRSRKGKLEINSYPQGWWAPGEDVTISKN